MANVAQGMTVSWAGVTLGEVVSVSVDGISAGTVDVTPRSQLSRDVVYSATDVDYGTVSVTLRGTDAMAIPNVGLTGLLQIGGPGASWSAGRAIFERLGWSATVGELQTWSVTFKVGA